MINLLLLRHCDGCGNEEERVLTDSWTGISLCLMCLFRHPEVIAHTSLSPASDSDNFVELLKGAGLMEEDDDGS